MSVRALPANPTKSSEEVSYSLGMVVALAAWAMMFAALFFAYLGARARYSVWPPADVPHLPVTLPFINTLVLLGSSAAISRAIKRLAAGDKLGLTRYLGLGTLLGVVFLGLQIVVWRDLWAQGLLPSSGLYGSVFYGLTGLHALHVVAGLGVLLVLLRRAFAGSFTPKEAFKVRVPALFWHFVDAMWVLMFLSIYAF